MSISERLKLVCQEKNWKLKDFSKATGLPYRTAQGYLNGTREPNAEGMAIICLKLNVNLNWLLTGYGRMFFTLHKNTYSTQEEDMIETYRSCSELGKKAIEINIYAISTSPYFS